MSTIWSSRARKRSFCPLSRCSFGRIESPPPADERRRNHVPSRHAICKIAAAITVSSGKHEDLQNSLNARKQRRLRDLHRRLSITVTTAALMLGICQRSLSQRKFVACRSLHRISNSNTGRVRLNERTSRRATAILTGGVAYVVYKTMKLNAFLRNLTRETTFSCVWQNFCYCFLVSLILGRRPCGAGGWGRMA